MTWERLDKRMVQIAAVLAGLFALVGAVAAAVALLASGVSPLVVALVVPAGAVVVVAASAGGEYIRWQASRYRLTEDRLELRFEFIVAKHRSLARDRIRTVDVTANPVQRLFGVARVVIGTGVHGAADASEIKLDPVSAETARQLREQLLRRPVEPGDRTEAETIAALDWRWGGYAVLSFLTPAIAAAGVGAVANGLPGVRVQADPVDLLIAEALRASLLVGVALAFGVLLFGAVGAVLVFLEKWWAYRLDREPGGTLHVRRGLLTTRSISLEERRLRGVELVEPLGVRLVKAARVDAVATGMSTKADGKRADTKTLLPAAPRAMAMRVAADILREDRSPADPAALAPHPRAALTRRLRWALAAAAVVIAAVAAGSIAARSVVGEDYAAVLAVLPLVVAVVAVALAVALARDAYRNLGHGLSGRYLIARSGWLARRTVALQRDGVIGWTARQSVFQRRAGVATLIATTAAGRGAYAMPDVAADAGVAFADRAVPGLLTPFLDR